jgi:hypothetical protein
MDSERLYIGNATRQMHDFHYCLAKGVAVRSLAIPAGTQARVPGELTPAQVDYILTKQAKYGIVGVDEIDRTRGFQGLCYSIGKPIASMRLTLLMGRNFDDLVRQGRKIREESAVAQSNLLERTLLENDRPERLTEMALTIQQERQDAGNDVPQFSEGFRVIRGGNDSPKPAGKRRRAA